MKQFPGFGPSEPLTPIPDSFFQSLLTAISDAAELKVTLYALWRIEHLTGSFLGLPEHDFESTDLGLTPSEARTGLENALARGSLLRAQHDAVVFYFLNSAAGRAVAEAFTAGTLLPTVETTSSRPMERPNVFRQYEENIGPLTPMIADALKDAEANHPDQWVEQAIGEAARHNKRSLSYIEAILKRWKEEGRAQNQDRRDTEKDRERSLDRKIDELRRRAKK
jgi:DnaD/phage-associated family protein